MLDFELPDLSTHHTPVTSETKREAEPMQLALVEGNAADLRRIGRHIDRVVLARAVARHTEDRVLLHENKTGVFS